MFINAFVNRLTSDFNFDANNNISEEMSELLRIKGYTDNESTGQFDKIFPILIAALKNDVAGRDVLSCDIIEFITVDLFKQFANNDEEWDIDVLNLEQFQNEFCDALEQKVKFF